MEHKAPATALAPLSLRYAVLGLALLLGGCRETAAPPPPPVPTVDVLTVAPRNVPIHREWVGTLDGADTVMRSAFWTGVYPGLGDAHVDHVLDVLHDIADRGRTGRPLHSAPA